MLCPQPLLHNQLLHKICRKSQVVINITSQCQNECQSPIYSILCRMWRPLATSNMHLNSNWWFHETTTSNWCGMLAVWKVDWVCSFVIYVVKWQQIINGFHTRRLPIRIQCQPLRNGPTRLQNISQTSCLKCLYNEKSILDNLLTSWKWNQSHFVEGNSSTPVTSISLHIIIEFECERICFSCIWFYTVIWL